MNTREPLTRRPPSADTRSRCKLPHHRGGRVNPTTWSAPAQGHSEVPPSYLHRVTLTRTEVARMLGCSVDFVDELIADGSLRASKVRRQVLVIASDVWGLIGLDPGASQLSQEARDLLRSMR